MLGLGRVGSTVLRNVMPRVYRVVPLVGGVCVLLNSALRNAESAINALEGIQPRTHLERHWNKG